MLVSASLAHGNLIPKASTSCIQSSIVVATNLLAHKPHTQTNHMLLSLLAETPRCDWLYAYRNSCCYNLVYLASRVVPTCLLPWSFTMTDCSALLDLICACHLQGGSHILSAVWDSIPHLLNMQNILRTKELDQCDNAWAVADLDDDSDSDSDVDSAHDSDSDSEFLLPQVSSEYNGTICCIAANMQTYDQSS